MVGWKIPEIFFLHSIMQNAGIFKIFLLVDLEDESCMLMPNPWTVCLYPAVSEH